jgi:hypothetical protein
MLQCYVLTCGRSVTAFLAPPRSQRPGQGPRSPHPNAGPDGVLNAQYSTSDCKAILKTGCIATLEGNHCITIFVMNQDEDR